MRIAGSHRNIFARLRVVAALAVFAATAALIASGGPRAAQSSQKQEPASANAEHERLATELNALRNQDDLVAALGVAQKALTSASCSVRTGRSRRPIPSSWRRRWRSISAMSAQARLERIAKSRGDSDLTAQLTSRPKLGLASCDVESGAQVSVTATGPAEFALLQACHRDLKRAHLSGDANTLQILSRSIPNLPILSAEQKAQLKNSAGRLTPELDAKTVRFQRTLHLMAGTGRSSGGDGATAGGRYLATEEVLEKTCTAPKRKSGAQAVARSALDKLRALSRSCDFATGRGCFP